MSQVCEIATEYRSALTPSLIEQWRSQNPESVSSRDIAGQRFWLKQAVPSEKTFWHTLGKWIRPLLGSKLLASNVDLAAEERLVKERDVLLRLGKAQMPVVNLAAWGIAG
ncbi:hypothetical protein [Dongshaea marina]|uniref:hypothetical protein n=1 Tax=Dongshaea marina TaxID=2047966 RepID=UPI000D3E6946|nr:hypothetical protein [Dongshaea marina]